MSVSSKDLKYITNYLNKGMELLPNDANYVEDTVSDFGVTHIWPNSTIKTSIVTQRDTKVEIVDKSKWGLTCYMNNSVQSCLKDEKIYHESLVHPVMSSVKSPKRVCIIGGGEGATLREVLRWKDVESVHMYEWDRDVVQLFRKEYPQWAQGAWDDERVMIIYSDIFKLVQEDQPDIPYDVIIIDLFDPSYDTADEEYNCWSILLKNITKWLSNKGSMVFYSGMRQLPWRKASIQRAI